MPILLALAVTLLVAADAVAGTGAQTVRSPTGSILVTPVGSPVRFVTFGRYDTAEFSGRFEIQGAYHYGYVTNRPEADARYSVLELTFDPDPSYLAELPFWRGFQPAIHLEIANPKDFTRAVMSPGVGEKLRRKEVFSASGRAHILVEDYKTWLECDSAHYSVRFVAVVQPQPIKVAQSFVRPHGC